MSSLALVFWAVLILAARSLNMQQVSYRKYYSDIDILSAAKLCCRVYPEFGNDPTVWVEDISNRLKYGSSVFQATIDSDKSSAPDSSSSINTIGYAEVVLIPALPRPFALIQNVAVDPTYQRRGIGANLMQSRRRLYLFSYMIAAHAF
jgi:ribosomal protein S18 acetylase RimI-like enzyme